MVWSWKCSVYRARYVFEGRCVCDGCNGGERGMELTEDNRNINIIVG